MTRLDLNWMTLYYRWSLGSVLTFLVALTWLFNIISQLNYTEFSADLLSSNNVKIFIYLCRVDQLGMTSIESAFYKFFVEHRSGHSEAQTRIGLKKNLTLCSRVCYELDKFQDQETFEPIHFPNCMIPEVVVNRSRYWSDHWSAVNTCTMPMACPLRTKLSSCQLYIMCVPLPQCLQLFFKDLFTLYLQGCSECVHIIFFRWIHEMNNSCSD